MFTHICAYSDHRNTRRSETKKLAQLNHVLLALLIENLAGTLPPDTTGDRLATARAALEAMGPTDFPEAMLAARMITAHFAAQDSNRRAMQPEVGDAEAARLRANAVAVLRSHDAAQRLLDKRRAPAEKPAPLPRKRVVAAPETESPEQAALASFTPDEIAAAEYALDHDPVRLAQAELEQRVPLHRFQDMTVEERKIAYTPPNKPTPAQVAVLGARIAAANRRAKEPVGA